MAFFPFERLTIKTYLPPDEVKQTLADVIEPKQLFRRRSKDYKPYQGILNGYCFEITRIIHYRNSFLPVIKGEIYPDLGGSAIRITMRPHSLVIIFMLGWLGITGLMFLVPLAAFLFSILQLNDVEAASLISIVPEAAFFAFGYILCTIGFKIESIKAKTFLQDLFAA